MTVRNAEDRSRYELVRDGEVIAVADYRVNGDVVVLPHTEVVPHLRGQGYGAQVVQPRSTISGRGQARRPGLLVRARVHRGQRGVRRPRRLTRPVRSAPVTHLAHTVLGHGPAFVWGHGLTSSRASEDRLPLLDWSAFTGAGRQVVRYDAAGHGETGGPADPAAYQWPELARDLLALLDVLGLDRVDAGGASMGCASTLHAAVRAPERFDRLVLVIPPTAWETRAAQAEIYEAGADLAERDGKAAWLAAAADRSPPGDLRRTPRRCHRRPTSPKPCCRR